MSKIDPASGRPRKRTFGPWIFPILRILSRGKVLRGTRWDPFGYTAERQTERALISDYERSMEQIMKFLSASTYEAAVQLAGIPEMIRGFGPVKSESVDRARARARELMNALRATEFAEA